MSDVLRIFAVQEISLTLSFGISDSKPTSFTVATALEQIDGFGCGPKRRKIGEEAYEEEGADAADDDDDDGAQFCPLMSIDVMLVGDDDIWQVVEETKMRI
jgi:hypothetical protein